MTSFVLTADDTKTLLQKFSIRALGLFGWTVAFKDLPGPRGVIVVYPHTSNWDFLVGLLAKWSIGMPFKWLGKESLFRYGLGTIMRAWGGEPVERSSKTGAIARLAERINKADFFWLALAPEGTRKYMPGWRSGFYHITLAAKVPLGVVRFDYKTKTVSFVDFLTLTGDLDADTAKIRKIYEGCVGYHPGSAAPIVFGAPPADK